MVINEPSIWIYHCITIQRGFQFPFSNESLTNNKIQFLLGKYDGIVPPLK